MLLKNRTAPAGVLHAGGAPRSRLHRHVPPRVPPLMPAQRDRRPGIGPSEKSSSAFPPTSAPSSHSGTLDARSDNYQGGSSLAGQDADASSANRPVESVARRILSDERLEGGSMLPFLAVSEAYWKV